MPRMEFGYNPPSGERGQEVIRPREFLGDLHNALDVAAERFDSVWVSDHLNYSNEFRIECWTMLTWIAARYPRPNLGTIVMSNSFRSPALVAKMGASLQAFSLGRFILGYGAGWYKDEYISFGYKYPSLPVRVQMLEEGVQIIKSMWTGSPASFDGEHYQISEVSCEPLPDPVPPIMIGGSGERYTLKAVAKYADWWNDLNRPPDQLKHKLNVLKGHCADVGRNYDDIRKTLAVRVFIETSHKTAVKRAAEFEGISVAGDPVSVVDQFNAIAELGFDLCILNFPTHFQNMNDVRLFMDKVMPAFR